MTVILQEKKDYQLELNFSSEEVFNGLSKSLQVHAEIEKESQILTEQNMRLKQREMENTDKV